HGASCKDVVGTQLLKERLDVDTLESLKLVSSTKLFQQKYIKTKTRLFYKQQKFNLLREEMEGYSKLATELAQLQNKDEGAVYLLENIKSLIGCFNIDPNRVLDLILESFECHPKSRVFVPLLENYLVLCEKSTLCQMLGFKFAHYQVIGMKTPESLYIVSALLMQKGLVDLDDLLVHLVPEDDVLTSEWSKIVEAAKEKVRKMNIVNLSGAEKEEKEEKPEPPKLENQKFGLCEGLLRVGDWDNAKELMDRYETNYAMAEDSFVHALSQLISATIDPFYRRVASVKGSQALPPAKLKHGDIVTPSVKEYGDLTENVFDMLNRLGPRLACDPLLMAKIIRIGRMFFHEYHEANEEQQKQWHAVYGGFLGATSNVFLPALSLLECNANMSEEVWVMLRMLPYQKRYRLYGEWKNDVYERHPDTMLMQAKTVDRTKYIMRRLTKENVKQSGRQMGKLSHGNPVVLFDCILNQIQRYDNMINPVVDAFKYLTNLSYDALAFCIIEALANPLKERMKYDDTNISDWLQSLASFSGAVFKKYTIELSGLLQYVANQLKAGKSLDLLILKEVVQKMSGIEISEEVTRDQLEALGGGELLKAEGGYFGQIRNTKKSSNRLKEALLLQKLELPMCVLISQHRHAIVFEEGEEKHLKLVGKLTDQCHDTLVQFGNFLSIQLSMDEYVKRFPPIDVLARDYHTPVDVAYFLSRPMYANQISSKYDEIRRSEKSKQKSSSLEKNQRYITACQSVMNPVYEMIKGTQPDKVWNDISPQFYTTFWSLSLYDVQVPTEAYDREISKLRQQVDGMLMEGSHDTRKRRERERCESLASKLKEEQRKQEDHKARVRARLKSEREGWFLARTSKNDAITKFLQLCVFPRCVFSPLDAIYCAKFIQIMHLLRTPNFSTLLCFDRVFSDISYTVVCFSENEASRYGRFLASMLEIVMRWHKEKEVYEKECKNYPGFVTVLRTNATDGASKANHLDYENFRHVCHKWQFKLTKASVVCLDSKDYCSIRNALIILTKILPFFPMVTSLGNALEKRVEKIKEEKEKRPDLYALAMGYSGQLRARRSTMVPEHEFHFKDQTKPANSKASGEKAAKASKSSSEKVKTDSDASRRSKSLGKEKKESTEKSKDRGRSKDKMASGDASNHRSSSIGFESKESSRSRSIGKSGMKSPQKQRSGSSSRTLDNEERERKRRKIDASDIKAEKLEKREKSEKRSKSSSRDILDEERKSSKSKRESIGKESKRIKTENGSDEIRVKEKHRKSDGGEKAKKSSERESRKASRERSRHAR
uniref:THO complex subunit 2-like n=1 Tax=Styela clava TaxID=7725 RepID=UPI00193A5896